MSDFNGYDLSKRFWAFAFNKPECKAIHAGLYFYMVDLNNRLGWKESFGLPNESVMEALSIGNRTTFYSALSDLEAWGFVKIVSQSTNQYTARVVSLCLYENEQAHVQALNKHIYKQSASIDTGTVHIDKPVNLTTLEPTNDRQPKKISSLKSFQSNKHQLIEECKAAHPAKDCERAFNDMLEYCQINGKSYKDYKMAFFRWVGQDRFNQYDLKTKLKQENSTPLSPLFNLKDVLSTNLNKAPEER